MSREPNTVPAQDGDLSSGKTGGILTRLRGFTPTLAFMTVYLSAAAFNFGYDQGNFSGLQAMHYFDKEFGQYVPKKKDYALPSYLQSIMTSMPYLGKLLGCWVCAPVTERVGRKKMLLVIAMLSFIGTSLQISATTAAQFTVGRVVLYFMAGFTVSVVPVYLGECSPPELRGLVSAQLQFQINFAIMIASFVNLGASNVDSPVQWKITVAISYLMPTALVLLWWKVKESPRWLVSKGRRDEAVESLRHFRKKTVSRAALEIEIDIIRELGNEGKGGWKEVFNKANRQRTAIACFVMFGQQITGQVFGSQYGTVFYKQQGVSDPFLMQSISTVVSLVCIIFTSTVLDSWGRRVVLLTGGTLQIVFMYCLGGVGLIKDMSNGVKYLLVVFLILDGASYNVSWGSLSYITIGEVSNSRVREKVAMLAVSVSIITAFVVSFTLPYLMNAPYANLGAKVGFIYGSLALCMVISAFFLVPELKGRSLEEVDELFESGISMRKFKRASVPSTRADFPDSKAALAQKDEENRGDIEQVEIITK